MDIWVEIKIGKELRRRQAAFFHLHLFGNILNYINDPFIPFQRQALLLKISKFHSFALCDFALVRFCFPHNNLQKRGFP